MSDWVSQLEHLRSGAREMKHDAILDGLRNLPVGARPHVAACLAGRVQGVRDDLTLVSRLLEIVDDAHIPDLLPTLIDRDAYEVIEPLFRAGRIRLNGESMDWLGWSRLCERPGLLRLFLKNGLNPNLDVGFRRPLLVEAMLANNPMATFELRQAGADLKWIDDEGNTLLHVLADLRRDPPIHYYRPKDKPIPDCDFAAEFVNNGTDVNAQNSGGDTALHLAAAEYDRELLAELVECGADASIVNPKTRETPLHELLRNRTVNPVEEVELLLDAGAPVNAQSDIFGQAALHLCDTRPELMQLLINRGADVHARDEFGQTPLHHSAEHYRVECVSLLLNTGADPNVSNYRGLRPIDLALQRGQIRTVCVLLDHGAKIDK